MDVLIEDRWRRRITWVMWLFLHEKKSLGIREIARRVGVAPSTVSRGVVGARRIAAKAENKEWMERAMWLLDVSADVAAEYIEAKLRPVKPPRKRYDLCT